MPTNTKPDQIVGGPEATCCLGITAWDRTLEKTGGKPVRKISAAQRGAGSAEGHHRWPLLRLGLGQRKAESCIKHHM